MNVFICGHNSPVERALEELVRITGEFTGLFSYEYHKVWHSRSHRSVSRIDISNFSSLIFQGCLQQISHHSNVYGFHQGEAQEAY